MCMYIVHVHVHVRDMIGDHYYPPAGEDYCVSVCSTFSSIQALEKITDMLDMADRSLMDHCESNLCLHVHNQSTHDVHVVDVIQYIILHINYNDIFKDSKIQFSLNVVRSDSLKVASLIWECLSSCFLDGQDTRIGRGIRLQRAPDVVRDPIGNAPRSKDQRNESFTGVVIDDNDVTLKGTDGGDVDVTMNTTFDDDFEASLVLPSDFLLELQRSEPGTCIFVLSV